MRCSKCNSPLISGEPICKICGTKIEDMQKDLEVIDFDINDGEEEFINEVLDNSDEFMDTTNDAVEEDSVSIAPVSLDEIRNTPVDESAPIEEVEKPKEVVIDLEEKEEPEEKMSQTLIDIMMKPIVLEDTIKLTNEDIEKEVQELKEAKETKTTENSSEEVDEVKEESNVPELPEDKKEVFKPEKKKKEIKSKEHDTVSRTVKSLKPNTKGADLTVVILAVILIVSIVLNVYLFVSSGKDNTPAEDNTTTIIKTNKVVFDGYELTVNNGWTVSNKDSNLILSDTSNEWTSKTFVVADVNYNDFVQNVDNYAEQMKEQKYQFTSNYEKKVDGAKLYLFKGKYENYTTFIIVGSIDKETLSVTEVKFENEVNDKTLDKIMSAIVSIEVTNDDQSSLDTKALSDIVVANGIAPEEPEED